MFKDFKYNSIYGSLEQATHFLSNHKVYTEQFNLEDLKVSGDLLFVGTNPYPMTEAFAPRLMKLLSLPNKNIEVLDTKRLEDDINFRIGITAEENPSSTVGLRFMNQEVYDVYQVKKDNLVIPPKHSFFLESCLRELPILKDTFSPILFDYDKGLRVKTRSSERLVRGINGTILEIGLKLENIDYNRAKYGYGWSFHIYNTENNTSVTNIDRRFYKLKKAGSSKLDNFFAEVNFHLTENVAHLYKAVHKVFETNLTEFVFNRVQADLKKVVGKKGVEMLLLNFMELNRDSEYVFNKEYETLITEYEFLQNILTATQECFPENVEKVESALSFVYDYHMIESKMEMGKDA